MIFDANHLQAHPAARARCLDFPPKLLALADEVIE
jgi:hypothetical protein